MKVYSHRPNPAVKDQRPFIEPSHHKGSEKSTSFFGSNRVSKKEETGQKPADEEKKNDLKAQNKDLEKDKDQVKQKQIQRKGEEEQKDPKAQEPQKEEQEPVKKKSIHRKTLSSAKGVLQKKGQEGQREASPDLEQRIKASEGKGFALPDDLRKDLESKMSYDFSHVRIHTDVEAVNMAEELEALAFTHGNDIYFNKGQYAPDTPDGRQLLVHELTHVTQSE
ncbi:MAG: eCIS core domain-containing protein [Adhaeribacter sp.]